VYYFHANGQEKLYLASADWMDRNVFRRVEICFPIQDPQLKQRLIGDLDLCLQDNLGAWELQASGAWNKRRVLPGEKQVSAQQTFLERLSESAPKA